MATFWNEAEWLSAALKEIEAIDPAYVCVCEGNFDPAFPTHSTDGTKEILTDWVNAASNRMLFKPCEYGSKKLKRLSLDTKVSGRLSYGLKTRLKYALSAHRFHFYRLNQALTFANMARHSPEWKPGRWAMTYDADQFYSDEQIGIFRTLEKLPDEYCHVIATENTFLDSFDEYVNSYEKRTWNNMPFRIANSMSVYPTRHFFEDGLINSTPVHLRGEVLNAGRYFHYKFRNSKERADMTYQVGDRKPPEEVRTAGDKYACPSNGHPSIIQELFLS